MISFDEFGPVELRPQHGRTWRPRKRPARIRATYRRMHGVRQYLAAYDVHGDKLMMRCYKRKRWKELLSFLKFVRSKYPEQIKLCVVLDNFSPHKRAEIRRWAKRANVVLVFTPTYASWLNRIEAIFAGVKYFVFGNTDYANHAEIEKAMRRYVAWRNRRPNHLKLQKLEKHKPTFVTGH